LSAFDALRCAACGTELPQLRLLLLLGFVVLRLLLL